MSTVHCDVCGVDVAGIRAHERTAGHQRSAPLYAAARATAARARKDGLERLISSDFAPYERSATSTLFRRRLSSGEVTRVFDALGIPVLALLTPVFDALGIPVLALPTGFRRGARDSHNYDELWTESWAANIANWSGVDVETRTRALERVAADPNLREHVRDWPPVIIVERYIPGVGVNVHVVGLEFSAGTSVWISEPGRAHLMIVLDPLNKWSWVDSWRILLNEHGQIIEIQLDAIHGPPPLHVMIDAQAAIEQFAQCSAIIRWLAGAP